MQDLDPLTIRPATEADAAVLGNYGASLMSLHHNWDPARFIPAGPATPEKYGRWIASQIPLDNLVILVAEERATIIGYVYGAFEGPDYMAFRGPAGVIHDIFVDPAKRRKGIGRELLQRAIANLSGKGASQIVLSTAHRNQDGQALFKRMGFRATMIEMTMDCERDDA